MGFVGGLRSAADDPVAREYCNESRRSKRERESHNGEKDVMPFPEIIEPDGEYYGHHRHA
jgi:hypothetical protein